jgi:predicted permease
MRMLRAWAYRLCGLVTRGRRQRQFDAELESHIELHVEDGVGRGLSPEEARRQALLALGGVQSAREAYRDRGGIPAFDTIGQDARFGFRVLRKAPGFTCAAVIVLALGIGANAAVFSLINALLLRPLNGGSLDAPLVGLYSGDRTRPDNFRPFSYPEYLDIRERNTVFSSLIAESGVRAGITERGQTRRIEARLVSSNFFAAQQVAMAAGRDFTRAEEDPHADAAVAIVSHDFWRSHGLATSVVGQRFLLNSREFTVVGVVPESFHGTMPVMTSDVWLPFGAARLLASSGDSALTRSLTDRTTPTLLLAGILKPSVSIEEANARLAPLADGFAAAYPALNANQRLVVAERSRTGRGAAPRSDGKPLAGATVLMALASMVLFVACLNLANMLLARGGTRRQEIAVRLALGGSRARIVRQLVVEGLMLASLGGAGALLSAWLAARQFVATLRGFMGAEVALDVTPDVRVSVAVIVATVVSTLLFSLGPAWRLSKPQLTNALKSTAVETHSRRLIRLPGFLVATQIAVSLALLTLAGTFLRASAQAATADPGFRLAGGLIAQVDPTLAGLDAQRGRQALLAVLQRLRELPDVRNASFAAVVPLGSFRSARLMRGDEVETAVPQFISHNVVGARYFATMGLRMLAGRDFTAQEESRTDAAIAVVDRALAEQLFGGANPLGRTMHLVDIDGNIEESLQVVGIVPSVRNELTDPPAPHVYVPFGHGNSVDMTFHVQVDPASEARMLDTIRQTIRSVDERLPIESLQTLTTHKENSTGLWGVIFIAGLLAAFGIIALTLATVGVYGLRAYLVARRTREIGIRVALGATRRSIARLLISEGASIAATGILVGLALAVALVRVLQQSEMLAEVDVIDPLVYVAAALILAATIALASYVPARRALRIDPATALRPE